MGAFFLDRSFVQTFLPYADFERSAKVLDYKRLGKQRVEALQLLRGQWSNHPAAKMWKGFEYRLGEYAEVICLEWVSRGYQDTCLAKVRAEKLKFKQVGLPPWLGLEDLHRSHRSNLLRKYPEHYQGYFNEPNDLPYLWPTVLGVDNG
jgi:hypothetical protein